MLPLIRVEEHITEDGNNPFADWSDNLDAQAASKMNTYLTRIEQGNTSSLKPIKGAFQEVRIDWGAGYRVYIGKDATKLIILFGGKQNNANKKILLIPQNFGKNIRNEKEVKNHDNYTKF